MKNHNTANEVNLAVVRAFTGSEPDVKQCAAASTEARMVHNNNGIGTGLNLLAHVLLCIWMF